MTRATLSAASAGEATGVCSTVVVSFTPYGAHMFGLLAIRISGAYGGTAPVYARLTVVKVPAELELELPAPVADAGEDAEEPPELHAATASAASAAADTVSV